jgi:ribosomal protein S18 acetylase RimI-like enzyme
MRDCIDYGEKHAFVELRLKVNRGNVRARKLYETFGFVVVAERADELLMSRTLLPVQSK